MENIISTDKVTKVFNSGMPDEMRAVTEVSIEIGKGEIIALKGPSGSGKTSLLSLIGCMSRPTEGSIFIHAKDVAKLPERFLAEIRRRTFGFVFQHFNLIKGLSVIENVMLPLYPTGIKYSILRKNAEAILEQLEIAHKKDIKVQKLSGGEQQRVAIARSLINDPEIIIADEPTAHLDSKLSEDLIQIILNLNDKGKTIIMATHDPIVYEKSFISRTIEMRDGIVKKVEKR